MPKRAKPNQINQLFLAEKFINRIIRLINSSNCSQNHEPRNVREIAFASIKFSNCFSNFPFELVEAKSDGQEIVINSGSCN